MLIHNAVLTGSFSYAGADLSNISASADYSASLSTRTTNLETASGSFSTRLTAVSSSQQQISSSLLQVSASYIALSGSYNIFSGSASTRITTVSSSQQDISSSQQQISASLLNVIATGATTGSNSFRANQSITGSLVVSSTITAQTLVVQTVTSSIVYSSGSNLFGSALGDRQTFTGSVNITGSQTLYGNIGIGVVAGTNGAKLISAGQATSFFDAVGSRGITIYPSSAGNIHQITSDYIAQSYYSIAITARGNNNDLFISASGNIGIGTTAPNRLLDVSSGGDTYLRVTGNRGNSDDLHVSNVEFYNSNSTRIISEVRAITGTGGTQSNSGQLAFYTNCAGTYAERMRITSCGNVFINNSSGVSLNGLTNFLSVSSTTYNLFDISRFSDNGFGPNFYLVKSRNGSIGGNTIVTSGDNLGNINWLGANGTGFIDAASIKAEVDGSPGASNDMPGRLVFSTTADGAGSVTERMRITSGGNVGINNSAPCARLHVQGNAALEDLLYFCAGGSVNTKFVYTIASGADDAFILRRNHTTQGNLCIMSWTYNGFVGVGTVTPSYTLHVEAPSNSIAGYFKAGGTVGYAALAFTGNGGSNIGVLTTTSGCIALGRSNGSVPNQFGANLDFLINCANGNILINSSLAVVGSVSKGSGSFKIKHPLASKKCTHQLVHSFIEGPQADLIYRGKINLESGIACVNIDCASRMTEGTFEALNRCSQVFTTNESSWDAIRGKLHRNILVIESQNTESNDEISWMVIGERQDEHMLETEWTDEEGRVITEPEIAS